MAKQTRTSNARETLQERTDVLEKNLLVWKGLDEKNFNKFLESFGDEKEKNKAVLSQFLNSNNVKLSQLGSIKINIDNINNFVANNPDFSKDIEKKIAKLFIKNLYEQGKLTIGFRNEFERRFCPIKDLETKDFDFKSIQIGVRGFSDRFSDLINRTTVSNDEIFDDLSLNKISTFHAQDLDMQSIIQDILEFELKDLLRYMKNRGNNVERDMVRTISPISTISEIFDKVQDPEIEKLKVQKGGLSKKEEIKEIDKKIREKYIENFAKMGMDKMFILAMKKLVANDFNFSQLEKQEQTTLRKTLIVDNIGTSENKWANYADFDQKEFKKFMKDLYDFEKDDIKLQISGKGEVNLKVKKQIKNEPIQSFSDVENFRDMDMIQPITFTVNIDDNDEEIIKDLESEGDNILRKNGIMETHITKGGPISIGNGYELEICGKIITKSQLDDLLDCDFDDEELNKRLEKLGLLNDLKDMVSSTKKELFNSQNFGENLDEYGQDQTKAYGYGPYGYQFGIFKEMLKKIDVKVAKRNLIFDGKNVNTLSQLYIMSKLGGDKLTEKKGKQQDKKIKELLGDYDRGGGEKLGGEDAGRSYANDIFEKFQNLYTNFEGMPGESSFDDYVQALDDDEGLMESAKEKRKKLNKDGKLAFKEELRGLAEEYDGMTDAVNSVITSLESKKEEIFNPKKAEEELDVHLLEDEKKTNEKKFLEARNSLKGDKAVEEMKPGVKLYFDLGESQLQPKDISDALRSYYCFEIVDVGEYTFTLRAVGGDLKSDLINKKPYILPKTAEQLESMKKGGEIFRVKPGGNDWNSCLENINNAKFFKEISAFGTKEGQVTLSGNKFVNEKGEEIKYFDRTDSIFDNSSEDKSKWGQGSKIYKYEIKSVNPGKGTVKIASTFDDIDENSETVKCDYENELPFEQFILLMEGKKLKGYTQAEQKEMETKYNIKDPKRLPTKGRREWISIGSIINVFKNTTKAIKTKMDEKRKEQDEILENYLFSYEGLNLYSKLGGLLGGLGLTSMRDVMKQSEYEFYTNRENRTWKRIEQRYKIFQADPNYSELYKEQLIPILKKPGYRGTDKDRYQFAAAFLMMLKKEGPCPRDFTTEIGKGNWVEKFLGPEHKVRFLNFYEKKKNELEQTKDMGQKKDVRLDLQEELNKLEYMYIFNAIEGNAPHGPDSNEFMLKSIWSTKFSGELKANLDGYFDKHDETKKEMKTFYAAEEQYLRTVGAGRFNKALPSLERMLELANTPGEVFRAKGYFMAAMLIGIIKNNSTKDTIKSFWGTSRAIGFTPGFWIVDTDSQDKVKIMLDGITNGDFSKALGSNLEKYKLGDLKEKNYDFVKDFQSYWNSHGKSILKKIEDPSYKDENKENDKSVIDLSEDEKNPNAYVFKSLIDNTLTNEIDKTNDQVKSVSLYQKESPLSATNNTMKRYIPNKGQYSRVEKEEDRADAESFWQSIIDKNCIPKGPTTKQKTDFLFEKYFNRFNDTLESSDKKMIVRSIKLIQNQKKEADERERSVAKYMLRYMIKGMMHQQLNGSFPPEFETVMNDFVEFFFDNIEHIDSKTIKKTFKNDGDLVREYDNPYRMLNRSQYRRYKMTTLKGNMSSTKTRYSNMIDLWLRKYNLSHSRQEGFQELDVNDFINTPIESIWKNCDKYGVSPKINISLSKSGIPLDVATETNETIKEKTQMLDKLQDYYDEQEAMAA